MSITVRFTAHRTLIVACGAETIEVPLPTGGPAGRPAVHSHAVRAFGVAPERPVPSGTSRSAARPPVIGVVQGDDERRVLAADTYARIVEQTMAETPVRIDEVEDFNVTNLSMRALQDDVRDGTNDQPLVLDVLVDPAGLDHEIALERLRRIVNDRSNPIDAIRLIGTFES